MTVSTRSSRLLPTELAHVLRPKLFSLQALRFSTWPLFVLPARRTAISALQQDILSARQKPRRNRTSLREENLNLSDHLFVNLLFTCVTRDLGSPPSSGDVFSTCSTIHYTTIVICQLCGVCYYYLTLHEAAYLSCGLQPLVRQRRHWAARKTTPNLLTFKCHGVRSLTFTCVTPHQSVARCYLTSDATS